MAHKPFNLHKRLSTKGKPIYYVQFYDDSGRRSNAISTGMSSKSAAETWAYSYLQEGKTHSKRTLSFSQYTEDFFKWDKCFYVESQRARGNPISHGYTDALRSYLVNHIYPHFKDYRLILISPKLIEEWLLGLRVKNGRTGQKLSATTINQCLNTLRIVLGEATRLGFIPSNPANAIKPLKKNPRIRGMLTLAECRKLLNESTIDQVWDGDLRHFGISLLAASTGMRLGEIQGLQYQHLSERYVEVENSYDRKYGLLPPKRNSRRVIPLPLKTARFLQELRSLSPFQNGDDLVFFGTSKDRSLERKMIEDKFYSAMKKIGISPNERKQRNITFHSWRHFFNSWMRTRIPDAKLQRLTGHKTLEMTEHYTHFNLDDFQDVLVAQEALFRLDNN